MDELFEVDPFCSVLCVIRVQCVPPISSTVLLVLPPMNVFPPNSSATTREIAQMPRTRKIVVSFIIVNLFEFAFTNSSQHDQNLHRPYSYALLDTLFPH